MGVASAVLIFFFQAEDGIRDKLVTGVQTCALPIWSWRSGSSGGSKHTLRKRHRCAVPSTRCCSAGPPRPRPSRWGGRSRSLYAAGGGRGGRAEAGDFQNRALVDQLGFGLPVG